MTTHKRLIKAVEDDNTIEVKRLLENGADVNARGGPSDTLLHLTCLYGRLEIARLLIEHGADINARQTYGGKTPIDLACLYVEPNIVRLLFEAGADPNILDERGFGPLDRAMVMKIGDPIREEIIDLFRQHAPELVMEAFCVMSYGDPAR